MSNKQIKMKPGKGQSMFAFGVGLVMTLIGLVVVVPTMGIFGVLWTLVAGGITVMHGANAFSDKGIPTHEIIIEEEDRTGDTQAVSGPEEEDGLRGGKGNARTRLEEAKYLYDSGLITHEEYVNKRKQILEEL